MNKDIIDGIVVLLKVALGVLVISALFFPIVYESAHRQTVILHSDTGDYACGITPFNDKPHNCEPIEEAK